MIFIWSRSTWKTNLMNVNFKKYQKMYKMSYKSTVVFLKIYQTILSRFENQSIRTPFPNLITHKWNWFYNSHVSWIGFIDIILNSKYFRIEFTIYHVTAELRKRAIHHVRFSETPLRHAFPWSIYNTWINRNDPIQSKEYFVPAYQGWYSFMGYLLTI